MFSLFLLGLIVLIIYWATKSTPNVSVPQQNIHAVAQEAQTKTIQENDAEWIAFLSSYLFQAKTSSEKKLLQKIISDAKALQSPQNSHTQVSSGQQATSVPIPTISEDSTEKTVLRKKLTEQIDNATLLLYFGAFLFVASAGLFVAFSDVDGVLKTFIVLLVSLVMYGSGLWIHGAISKLKPAGLAFAGIGISIAPLVGLAAYNYVLPNNGILVWFFTSVFCVALYGHALLALRAPLMNYVFIFTLLSLFESAVAIIDTPIYYYGWAMALLGICLQLFSYLNKSWEDMRESSESSGKLFLSLAVLISFVIIPAEGVGQLGVSFLLAALYFGIDGVMNKDSAQANSLLISHVSVLSAIACLTFNTTNNLLFTGNVIATLGLLQSGFLLFWKKNSLVRLNYGSVLIISLLINLIFLLSSGIALSYGVAVLLIASLLVWHTQDRDDAYIFASVSWVALGFIVGQYALQDSLSASVQAGVVSGMLVPQIALFLVSVQSKRKLNSLNTMRNMVFLHAVFAVLVAMFTPVIVSIGLITLTSVLLLSLVIYDKNPLWGIISGFMISATVVRTLGDDLLVVAIILSLAYNILLALKFRSESSRWISTVLWLLFPLGLGGFTTENKWTAEAYAWSYVLVMAGLMLSRAIARGAIMPSSKVPLASYAKTASLSYVYGYVTAAVLAVGCSLASDSTRLHTSLILALMTGVIYVAAKRIEKRSDIHALQPFILQFLLWSLYRPDSSSSVHFEGYLLLSAILAVGLYIASHISGSVSEPKKDNSFLQSSLVTVLLPVMTIFITGETFWPMPITLFVFGCLLIDYLKNSSQGNKELAASLMSFSVLWMLSSLGLKEFQVYTHVIALTTALFAYWRHTIGDNQTSDSYIYATLGIATIPLILQALGGTAGDIYGWWLLLEQVVIMLIGMAIGKKFVVNWGMYVAVGAVLYQLRELQYIALSLLAMFVIGIAVYRLQKSNK